MRKLNVVLSALIAVTLFVTATSVQAAEWGLKAGTPELKSAGSLTFGPEGILFVGDAKSATIFAIDTGDASGDPASVKLNIPRLGSAVAKALGGDEKTAQINDLAVNPSSGNAYLSVPTAGGAALLRIDSKGKLSQLSLKGVKFSKVVLPNPPEDKETGQGRRRRNRRIESITDLAYIDGKVLVSGLSDATAPSTVREIAFPFADADEGINIEIYHGAHGRYENYPAVRTFVPFTIDGKPNLLAGFTCTPLVKFPLAGLSSGKPLRGTTVAELGNRNRPLDMIVYQKGGKDFLLMANSARGVMKISTEGISRKEGITERVGGGGVAGQTYETIESLQGVVQLDKLNEKHALIVVQTEDSPARLQTVALP
ncbi:MAG: hypothetical protein VB835_10700 [Pirellulales bacterium]